MMKKRDTKVKIELISETEFERKLANLSALVVKYKPPAA